MPWSTHTREARGEFRRLYLGALTSSLESQVAQYRAEGQRRKLRRAEERLVELRWLAGATDAELAARPTRPVAAFVTVTLTWLACGAILGLCVAFQLDPAVRAVADLALLGVTVVWLPLAVACTPSVT
jgi:hypothetical protein